MGMENNEREEQGAEQTSNCSGLNEISCTEKLLLQ